MTTKNKLELELLQRLSHAIQNKQSMNDSMANALMQQLNGDHRSHGKNWLMTMRTRMKVKCLPSPQRYIPIHL